MWNVKLDVGANPQFDTSESYSLLWLFFWFILNWFFASLKVEVAHSDCFHPSLKAACWSEATWTEVTFRPFLFLCEVLHVFVCFKGYGVCWYWVKGTRLSHSWVFCPLTTAPCDRIFFLAKLNDWKKRSLWDQNVVFLYSVRLAWKRMRMMAEAKMY